MKRLLVLVFAIVGFSGLINAQDAKKALKNASKDLAKYYQDPITNAGKLTEALDAVNVAFQDDAIKADPASWITKGEIFNTVGNAETTQKLVNPKFEFKYPNAGLDAVTSFKTAISLAAGKKNIVKDAVAGLIEAETLLSNAGITTFEKSDYVNAFKNFNTYLEISKLIKDNGGKTKLDDAVLMSDIKYYTAVAGYYGKVEESSLIPILTDMYKSGTDKSLIYEALFNLKLKNDEAGAMSILQEGRNKFPEESNLLFAEINYYLGKKQIEVLVDKLKLAITKEPNNVSLYTTLGNVYDQLITKEREANNPSKEKEYFDLAYDYYNQALAKDPKNFDATYSIGALYYNKAATYTAELNKLNNDFSKSATEKYNKLKAEMDGVFDQALPYFSKAEGLDGSDVNTIIALKEIYARKGDFEKVNAYKTKLEGLKKD